MNARKLETGSSHSRRKHGEALKDEVYRQMFRLEARRPGAEIKLAIALLHAWLDSDSRPNMRESRQWLRKVSPICVDMIEATQQRSCTDEQCAQ
jgi:cell division FtsZ-interacting protein ZapD